MPVRPVDIKMDNLGDTKDGEEEEEEEVVSPTVDPSEDLIEEDTQEGLNESVAILTGQTLQELEHLDLDISLPEIPVEKDNKEMKQRRNATNLRKYGIINVETFGGPESSKLLDNVEFTVHRGTKDLAVNGIKYNDQRVASVNIKTGEVKLVVPKGRVQKNAVKEFRSNLAKARAEYQDTPQPIIDEQTGIFVGRITTEDIMERTEEVISEILQETIDDSVEQLADEKEDMERQISTTLSSEDFSEEELALTGSARKKFVEAKIKGLVGPKVSARESSEKENFLDNAKEERRKAAVISGRLAQGGTNEQTEELEKQKKNHLNNALLFDKLAEMCELKADEVRVKFGLKPKTERVKNILKRRTEEDPRTRFARFRKWAKENLGALSAGAIAVAGIITSVALSFRSVVTKGAQATGKFAKGVYNVLKKLGPAFEIIGKILLTVLSLGSKALLFLANNLWIVAVIIAVYLYEKFGPSWWKTKRKS